jgi:hypothetical protein
MNSSINPTLQDQDYQSVQANQIQSQRQQNQQQQQSMPSYSQNYYNGSTLLGKTHNDSILPKQIMSCSLPQSASSLLSLSSNYSSSDVSSLSTSNNIMDQENSTMMMLMLDPTLSSAATQLSSSMQNDLLIAAGSVTNAMQTLCKELSAGENNQSNSNTSDDEVEAENNANNLKTNAIQADSNISNGYKSIQAPLQQFSLSTSIQPIPADSATNLTARQNACLSSSSTPVTYRRSLNNNISNGVSKPNPNWSKSEQSHFCMPNFQMNRMGINLDEMYTMENLNGTNICNQSRDNENDGDDEDNGEEAENYLLANRIINELVKNDSSREAQDYMNNEEDDYEEAAGLMQLSREQDEIINNHILITNLTNNNEIFRRELEQILIENNATITTNNNINTDSSSGSASGNNTEQEQQNEIDDAEKLKKTINLQQPKS